MKLGGRSELSMSNQSPYLVRLHRLGLGCGLLSTAFTSVGVAVRAQGSLASLQFSETGATQVELRIAIDDDAAGLDASAPCDVGAQDFTFELWLRASAAAHPAPGAGPGAELPGSAWSTTHPLVDRSLPGLGGPAFGLGIAGAHVRFYTGAGANGSDAEHVLEGGVPVLDGAWHHVACVRDAASGRKSIYVDGSLDSTSSANASRADLAYPNAGLGAAAGALGPVLVVGAAKDAAQPDYDGGIDELRAWTVARTPAQILASYERALPVANSGLVGAWRFEEGSGSAAADTSAAQSPAGVLYDGAPGASAWSVASQDPANVALVSTTPLPPGFAETVEATGLDAPVALAFLPDGRALIAERAGRVRMYASGALLPAPVIELPAEISSAERGLANLVLDPDFASNGWFYCYWTTHEPKNRVSRFTLQGAVAAPASEFVVWECPTPALFFHHGGGLATDSAGHLYIATGEHFLSSLAHDTSVQIGKLLRVNLDGTIPADNPYAAQGSPQDALWAMGLRNPFRMTFDAPTNALWIGDVGGNSTSSSEELLRVGAPADYGWPWQEGETCWIGAGACAGLTYPAYSYRHDEDLDVGEALHWTGAIICGPMLRSSAVPTAYRDQLYLGDFARREIRRVLFDAAGNPTIAPIFVRAPYASTVVDLEEGPDGALWYLVHGMPVGGPPEPAELRRIAYVGLAAAPPLAVASASPLTGLPPLAVQFSSAGSLDPQPGPAPLAFRWVFGDGAQSNEANPLHTYTSAGPYQAQLSITDGAATVAAAPLSIAVGSAPVAQILTPVASLPYAAGQTIQCSASASDPEDGALPPSAFEWYVLLQHDEHAHPFLGPVSGTTSFAFDVPKSGHPPEHTHYVVQLKVTDSDGLSTTVLAPLTPLESLLAIDSVPSGIPIYVDGEAQSTPLVLESLQGFEHQVAALAAWSGFANPLSFACWSDGGAPLHTYIAPVGGANLSAIYAQAGQDCASATCGYSTYGSAGIAQTLSLLGVGAPQPAAGFELRVVGLATASTAWLGLSAAARTLPLYQGALLIDPGALISVIALPASAGEAAWSFQLSAGTSAGLVAYFQAAAFEPGVPGGVAFSAGLNLTVCP
jgi:glucose/arabinose dehydrogenase